MNNPIDEILQLIREIQDVWEQFIRTVNSVLSWVPDFLMYLLDEINRLWEQLLAEWTAFWDTLNEYFEDFGNPFAVADASSGWRDQVGAPSGEMAATVTPGQLAADDDNWTGAAATRYRTRAGEQQETISALHDAIATEVVSALDGLKVAMIVLYAAIAGAFAAFIGAIVGGLASSATIVGIPAGILIIIAGFGVALTTIIGAFVIYSFTVDEKANQMRTAITGANVVRWPEFVAS